MRNKLHQKPNCASERQAQGADSHRVLWLLSLDFCFWQKGRAGSLLAPQGRFVDEYLCHPWDLCTPCFPHPLDVVFLLLIILISYLLSGVIKAQLRTPKLQIAA